MAENNSPAPLKNASMIEAFEAAYSRDWNDPAGDEIKEIWHRAWQAAVAAQAAPAAVAVPEMPLTDDPRPYYEDQPDGYTESVGEWVDRNITAVRWFMDHHSTVRAALAATPALPAPEDSSAGDLAEEKIAYEMSREERMIVLQRDTDGTPTVWCDPEIADIVSALNSGGVKTVASCSGHGVKPGGVALADGRQLLLLESLEAFNSAMSAITQAEVQAEPVTDEQIKAAFLANGFTIKEGLTDLKPYVYQAARALLQLAAPQAQPADALDADELKEVRQAINDFEECGETAVSYELLMRAANAGYLECARFEATQGGQKALDAAMAAAQEGGKAAKEA